MTARLRQIHPLLGTRDVERALDFYVERLGFRVVFRDASTPANYAVLQRDDVELHFQWQDEREMSTARLRILVDDPDALFAEFQARGALGPERRVADTAWGTREFDFYDPDGNALAFYRGLDAGGV